MGIAELINSLFSSQKKDHPHKGLELECKLLRSRVTELENIIKQVALDRAVMGSTLAISDSQLEELRFRKQMDQHQKSLKFECPVLRLRVAELEKKLGEERKQQAVCESAFAIKPFELAATESKLKELYELGLRKEDLDRSYEQIKMHEAKIAEQIEDYKQRIKEQRAILPVCKRFLFGT